jgi:hypothetical protein
MDGDTADAKAFEMVQEFEAERKQAQDVLLAAQLAQERSYNMGQILKEYQEGDLVVINRDSLRLHRDDKGKGHKLLPKYEGPFEVSEKISPVTYRLCMPASYGIHPVLNISHLEEHRASATDGLEWPEIQSK